MSQQTPTHSPAHCISETEFVRLCDGLYADRQQIYEFNPNAGKREALLWMLVGCLMSLLSISDLEQQSTGVEPNSDSYANTILEILRGRTRPPFDPQTHLAKLSKKIEDEEKNETR
jgi:hypothetical protein